MDESTDQKQQQVFVVAGFPGETRVWHEVERHWIMRLERDGLDYFRASEFNSMPGAFRKLVIEFGDIKAKEVANELQNAPKVALLTMSFRSPTCAPWMGSISPTDDKDCAPIVLARAGWTGHWE
jgi:hypothetical protein